MSTFRLIYIRVLLWSVFACATPFDSPTQNALGENLQLLSNDQQSYLKRIDLIDSAVQRIDVCTYELGDDPLSLSILAHLRQAARRGVQVRLIVDGHKYNNLLPKAMQRYLKQEGVDIRENQPDVRYKVELGRTRLHDKLLIIDQEQLLLGGRNMRQDYFGIGCKPFLDEDLYIVGCTARSAANYFDQRWNASTTGYPNLDRRELPQFMKRQKHPELNSMTPREGMLAASHLLDQAIDETNLNFDSQCDSDSQIESPIELCSQEIEFMHDQPDRRKGLPSNIERRLEQQIRSAKCSIELVTPYFAISLRLQKLLRDAAKRGVRIRILTNSLETTDHPIVHAQFAHLRRRLRRMGIELWEYHGNRQLHAKLAIFDAQTSYLGSYNFDMLSEKQNSEVGVLIQSKTFSVQAHNSFQRFVASSQKVPQKGSLIRYDAKTNNVDTKELLQFQIKRFISPWIRKYL